MFLPMTDLRNFFMFKHFNISAKGVNSLPVISTLCPINWVETRKDTLIMGYAGLENLLS